MHPYRKGTLLSVRPSLEQVEERTLLVLETYRTGHQYDRSWAYEFLSSDGSIVTFTEYDLDIRKVRVLEHA